MLAGRGLFVRFCGGLVALAFAVLTLLGVGLAGLGWRLGQGPLDIAWAILPIEDAVTPPGAPNRLRIGGASIAWRGFEEGIQGTLEVRVRDARITGPAGDIAAAASVDVALALPPLLRGEVLPSAVTVERLSTVLSRGADGHVALDGLPNVTDGVPGETSTTLDDAMAAVTRRRNAGGSANPMLRGLAALRAVRVRDSAVTLVDRQLGATLNVTEAALDLRRQTGGGLVGSGSAALALGQARGQLTVQADVAEGGTGLALALTPVSLAALAEALPGLLPAAQINATLQVSAEAGLTAALGPKTLVLRAAAGGGRALLPSAELAFESLTLEARAEWTEAAARWTVLPDALTVPRLQVVVASPAGGWDTTLGATGSATRRNGRLDAKAVLTVDHLAFADLPRLWPKAWGGHARPWLAENITAGTARDAQATLHLGGPADLSAIEVLGATATMRGDDVTIHWLRPVPPIEHAQAFLTVREADTIEIAVPAARQGAATLTGGLIRITGMQQKDQFLAISADVASSVPDLLVLLRHPRLHLLDRHPLALRNPAGGMTGKLTVNLPLNEDLQFSDVIIHAVARLNALRLAGLVAGRDLDRGDLAFNVTQDGLQATGRASVGGIPAAIGLEMDFKDGGPAQVVQRATATAPATAAQLTAAGLDPSGLIGSGTGKYSAAYETRRDGTGEIKVQADLRDAAMALAGWRKAVGQPAIASARLMLNQDRLQGITDLQAQGPGMVVRGRAEMVGDKPARLVLDSITLGSTRARGEVRLPVQPDEPIRARLTGSVLDLSTEFGSKPAGGLKSAPGEASTPWVADVDFAKVMLGGDRSVAEVTAHAEYDGRRLRLLHLRTAGPERLQVDMEPSGNGRTLSVDTADGGSLLRVLDVLPNVDGGRLVLRGRYDDSGPVPVLVANVDMWEFHVRNAPAIGKLLQVLTVYGIGDAISGPGLSFSQLTLPFRWDGDVLEVRGAQAFSASLGLTATGRVDTARKQLELKGTVVPAYVLNSALGRIPLLGRLFRAEPGGGLVAVDYTVRGPTADPSVSVNPLSALTPGFLRGLFHIFD